MVTTIVITGGCGYVGSRIAPILVTKGFKVIVADKATPDERHVALPKSVEFRKTDLRYKEQAEIALKDADYVLHLAANIGPLDYMHKYQADIIQENSAIDANVYPAAVKHKVKGIVYSSSSMVFQHPPKFPYKEEDIASINPPTNIYGLSKLIGEYFCKAYQKQCGLNYVILRYHNIYGPGEDSKGSSPGDIHVIPALLEKILIKKQYPLDILGDPNATRPFVYVDDAVQATVEVLEKMIKGDKQVINNDFNIASDKWITIKDLAELIWKTIGDSRPFSYKVVPTESITAKRREADTTKIKTIVGWETKVSLKEGILRTADWIRTREN